MFFTEAFDEFVEKIPREEMICKNLSVKPDEKFYSEVVRYLGYKNNAKVTPEIDSLIQKGIAEVCITAEPRAMCRCFSVRNSSLLEGFDEMPSENFEKICNLPLHRYELIILMGATLGVTVDRLLKRTQVRNMTYALILDSCATAAIESVCDNLQDSLTAIYADRSMYITNRYSPGYGNLPLSFQTRLLFLLDAERKIGLNVTKDFLLTPTKSVTAIIGVSPFQQKNERIPCSACKMCNVCNFRRMEAL
ncbi:MAG: hypothetical protein LBB21_03940 [Holosporaceae bacterium]|jgi:hypothetical protein|nr:hypothetical protein [Holosporaceae bacterium]